MIGIEVYEKKISQCRGHVPGVQIDDCACKNEWRFRIRAANGEIVAASEGYTTKASAEKGVRALRRALLPGTRDAEAMAKAWRDGADLTNGYEKDYTPAELDEANPYRREVPDVRR